MPANLFISYSSPDWGVVEKLRNRLQREGYRSLFVAKDPKLGIPIGEEWERHLYQEIKQCEGVIALCSKNYVASHWCSVEVAQARALNKLIFPLKLDGIKLSGDGCQMHPSLRILQKSDVSDLDSNEEHAFDHLVDRLREKRLDQGFEWLPDESPYPGLNSYEERHAAVYRGRDDEIGSALEKLRGMQRNLDPRLALVLGSSGCGKSSFVKAGLIPRLRRDDKVRWIVVGPFRPRNAPLEQLLCALSKAFNELELEWDEAEARARFANDVGALGQFAKELCGTAGGGEATVLLVVDQLEEVLRAGRRRRQSNDKASITCDLSPDVPRDQATTFLQSLEHVLMSEDCHFLALGTLRYEFRERLDLGIPRLGEVAEIQLAAMSDTKLAQVLRGSGDKAGIEFEGGLVEQMSRDASEPHKLPLLALKLKEMYMGEANNAWGQRHFTFSGYGKGLNGVVEASVRSIIGDPGAPGLMEQLGPCFLKMVDIDEDQPDAPFTRKAAPWDEFTESERDRLQKFVDGRLLVSHGDEVEPAHECLFRVWKELEAWLGNYREFLLWQKRVKQSRDRWYNSGAPAAYVLRGGDLTEAKQWMRTAPERLDVPVRKYIKASLRREAFERWPAGGAVAALLVSLCAAIWYACGSFRNDAKDAARELLRASASDVRGALEKLRPHERFARAFIRERLGSEYVKPQPLHAAYALADWGEPPDTWKGFLLDEVRQMEGGECANVVDALRKLIRSDGSSLNDELSRRWRDTKDPALRARYAILALYLEHDVGLAIKAVSMPEAGDPTDRSAFIHALKDWHGDLHRLAALLRLQQDPELCSALCAGLGRIARGDIPDLQFGELKKAFEKLYLEAPDGGTHSASGWALQQLKTEKEKLPIIVRGTKRTGWFVNSQGMTMIKIREGTFKMGNNCYEEESPEHDVDLGEFYLCDREVSVSQFEYFAADRSYGSAEQLTGWEGPDKRMSPSADCPVQNVDWFGAVRFCNWLSLKDGRTPCYAWTRTSKANSDDENADAGNDSEVWECRFKADGYRLPTEAEWEYACRGGSATSFCFGKDRKLLGEYGWFRDNSGSRCYRGAEKLPNAWGLFDMHGNVREWCWDWYGAFTSGKASNPTSSGDAQERITRGGGCLTEWLECRSTCRAHRSSFEPDTASGTIGFRVVCRPRGSEVGLTGSADCRGGQAPP